MSLFDSLFGRSKDDPRKEFVELVDTLEGFARDLIKGFGSPLVEGETPAREVLHAFTLGGLTALGAQRKLTPEQAMDIWVELNSRLFGSSMEEARDGAKSFSTAFANGTLQARAVDLGIAGFKHWQKHGIEEVSMAFNSLVTQHMLCALCSGGNGDSPANAVVVDATSSMVGVQAERAYIARECGVPNGDWQLMSQRMHKENGRLFDVLTINLRSGQERTFYFDIASFFGK